MICSNGVLIFAKMNLLNTFFDNYCLHIEEWNNGLKINFDNECFLYELTMVLPKLVDGFTL